MYILESTGRTELEPSSTKLLRKEEDIKEERTKPQNYIQDL